MPTAARLPILSAFALLTACTSQPATTAAAASAPQQCFSAKSIYSFHAIGDESVDVVVGTRRVYRLDLTGACTNIRWTNAVAVRTLGGSSWICRGVDAEVIVPAPSGPERCLVTSVRQLSDAEARALRYYR